MKNQYTIMYNWVLCVSLTISQRNLGPKTRNRFRSGLFFTFLFLVLGSLSIPQEAIAQNIGENFDRSPRKKYGGVACQNDGGHYNGKWKSYFEWAGDSMTITAGNDCRQVFTGRKNGCRFNIGSDAMNGLTFDFKITQGCHKTKRSMNHLAFFMTTFPKASKNREVDFIESEFGGTMGGNHKNQNYGLNSNFAGRGYQVPIYDSLTPDTSWQGTICATFIDYKTDSVIVKIKNSVNHNIAIDTISNSIKQSLAVDTGSNKPEYVFILNTTISPRRIQPKCRVTISNLRAFGKLVSNSKEPNNCSGLIFKER